VRQLPGTRVLDAQCFLSSWEERARECDPIGPALVEAVALSPQVLGPQPVEVAAQALSESAGEGEALVAAQVEPQEQELRQAEVEAVAALEVEVAVESARVKVNRQFQEGAVVRPVVAAEVKEVAAVRTLGLVAKSLPRQQVPGRSAPLGWAQWGSLAV
jgi:hypothetical protein